MPKDDCARPYGEEALLARALLGKVGGAAVRDERVDGKGKELDGERDEDDGQRQRQCDDDVEHKVRDAEAEKGPEKVHEDVDGADRSQAGILIGMRDGMAHGDGGVVELVRVMRNDYGHRLPRHDLDVTRHGLGLNRMRRGHARRRVSLVVLDPGAGVGLGHRGCDHDGRRCRRLVMRGILILRREVVADELRLFRRFLGVRRHGGGRRRCFSRGREVAARSDAAKNGGRRLKRSGKSPKCASLIGRFNRSFV